MTNKEIAVAFLKSAGMGNTSEAYERYVADNFRHHNQYFKGDRQSLKDAMQEDHEENPNISIDVFQVIEETNKVVTHSRVVKKEMEIAVVHIFKFENQKIVELWDLGQVIEKDVVNENGLF